ncbi:MAG TPA: ABC transporter substrate-binding protein, partial [Acidimicrobiia bacterium]|nr:ABC transporter substrate-binding protein [Acidimicrobiia bacterium]
MTQLLANVTRSLTDLESWAKRNNPVVAVPRGVRRFLRRPRSMQIRTLVVAIAAIVGLVVYVVDAPGSGSTAGLGSLGATFRPAAQLLADVSSAPTAGGTPVDQASTSDRGVTPKTINVAFPVANLSGLSSQLGFAGDVEFSEQVKAIKFFVGDINSHGGINGRKINPIITNFDPTNESGMRALCKDWTEGSPAAFAVLDGAEDWTGDNELCVAQEGQTPFLGAWTTVTNYTQMASPYLWWTGPDQAAILAAVVQWGQSAGLLGGSRKVGIIAGDRATDQLALNQYLVPDLRNIGVTANVQTIASNVSDQATTQAEAPLIVEKLKAAGVNSVIPLLPFNAFFPVLQAENQQTYYPKLLLSDYEGSIESALGLIPIPYEQALNGQQGVTAETLGGFDDARPESQGGYDPGLRSCFTAWHPAYPKPAKGSSSFYLEEQGPIAGWCQEIRLFAQAATMA